MKWTPEKVASAMYVLAAVAVLPMWYILFFVGNPSDPDYRGMFTAWFIDDPNRTLFWYHAALPLICAALAVAYISSLARTKLAVVILCCIGIVLALSAWFMSNEAIAIFVTLPLLFTVNGTWHLTLGAADACRRR